MTDTTNDENLGFFKRSQRAGIPFFHIFDNSICQKSKTEIDGWEGPIKTTNPTTNEEVHTWVMRYDSIAAYVIDADWFKKEFTKEQGGGKTSGIDLTLLAGTMKAMLTLKWGATGPDHVLKRFLKIAPNVDFNKPLLISAFRSRESKQAVSFRQGDDPDPQKWVKVEEYWRRPLGPDGKADLNQPSSGADGSILPEPIHDEFSDKWDYMGQNRFLLKYFMENILPKLKVIAEAHGLKQEPDGVPVDADGFPTMTGTAPEPIPVVTSKPANVVALSMADLATGAQRARIKQLSTQANFDFEAKCKEVLGCEFDELNKEGASFASYKLEHMIAAQGQPAPVQQAVTEMAVPAPVAPTAELPDDWGMASAPTEDDKTGIPWLDE